MGAPGATATGQEGTWQTRRAPNPATTLSGIGGPVYMAYPGTDVGLEGETPNARGVGARQRVTRKQGSGAVAPHPPIMRAEQLPETRLTHMIPSGLFQRARKWLRGDQATNHTIPGRAPFSQALNQAAPTGGGGPVSSIPIPADDWLSELVFRWYVGQGRYRFEDVEHGGQAAQIVADVEIARQTARDRMAPPHQGRLTGASLLPDSPTLSRYQQVIGTGDIEGGPLS